MGKQLPHALIIPFPVQGHVAPLMNLAHRISDHGINVTFVNSHFVHAKILAALPQEAEAEEAWIRNQQVRVRLASIPDGLDPEDDRGDLVKLIESVERVIPGHLKGLIEKLGIINTSNVEDDDDDSKQIQMITCIIFDVTLGLWPIEMAEKMGIQGLQFCPFGPATLAWVLHIPKLIEARIINATDGSPLNDELIYLSKEIARKSASEGGSSHNNFKTFIEGIKH